MTGVLQLSRGAGDDCDAQLRPPRHRRCRRCSVASAFPQASRAAVIHAPVTSLRTKTSTLPRPLLKTSPSASSCSYLTVSSFSFGVSGVSFLGRTSTSMLSRNFPSTINSLRFLSNVEVLLLCLRFIRLLELLLLLFDLSNSRKDQGI